MLERRVSQNPNPPRESCRVSRVHARDPRPSISQNIIHDGLNQHEEAHMGRTSFSFHPPQTQTQTIYDPSEMQMQAQPQATARSEYSSLTRASLIGHRDSSSIRGTDVEDVQVFMPNGGQIQHDTSWQDKSTLCGSTPIEESNWEMVSTGSKPRVSFAPQDGHMAVSGSFPVLHPIQEAKETKFSTLSSSVQYPPNEAPVLNQAQMGCTFDEAAANFEHGIVKISADDPFDHGYGSRQKAKSFAGWGREASAQIKKNYLPARYGGEPAHPTQTSLHKAQQTSPTVVRNQNQGALHKTQSLDNPGLEQVTQQRTLIPWNSVPVDSVHHEVNEVSISRPTQGKNTEISSHIAL